MKRSRTRRSSCGARKSRATRAPGTAKAHRLQSVLRKGQELLVVSRPASASPAVGYALKHMEQQKDLIEEALGQKRRSDPRTEHPRREQC
jgi:hypothetical protein